MIYDNLMLLPIYSSLVLQPESQRRTSRLNRLFIARIPSGRFLIGGAWVGDAPVSFVSGLQTLSCACPPLFTDRGQISSRTQRGIHVTSRICASRARWFFSQSS